LIEQMSKDKGIGAHTVVEAIKSAIVSAAKKKFGADADIEVNYDEETGELEAFQFKTVVERVKNSGIEISIAEARETLDPEARLHDSMGVKLDVVEFGRIAAQNAKQIIIQKVKDAEQGTVFEEFKDAKMSLTNGFIVRKDAEGIVMNIGRTEAILPLNEQIPQELFKRGERIKALIVDVRKSTKGPQIVVSRVHNSFLKALFEMEVPEISDGTISIVSVARDPGRRAKIAVTSKSKDVDPVGACVGMRGTRVQNIVQELRGERVDIIAYTEHKAQYICNALAPAKVQKVLVDDNAKAIEVIVAADQLSLAIGKGGQNVRLAAKLTGWKIDVTGEKGTSTNTEPNDQTEQKR
ncbi:MAG: transcription termination factor NusA, partial [Deltaproteobacteria bacterium]|nr:transcription termination factor NusA [Deltaproteobacteria bacterium]